jgi:hypothetical protein
MKLELVQPIKMTGYVADLFLTRPLLKMLTKILFFITVLVIADVQAVDCETMKLLKSKSQGVRVQNNVCDVDDRVSVGSRFILVPGGRLWLKAQTTDNRNFQLICQNRAGREVEVKYLNKFLPWIMPTGFSQCSGWINNKLSCEDGLGTKNDFICAIAAIKPPEYLKVTSLERTTSVKMRTFKKNINKSTTVGVATSELINIMAGDIRSEVGLCRNLYQVEWYVKATWVLGTLGSIEKLSFTNTENFDHQFRSCVESVIYNFSYPEFNENVVFSVDL